MAINFSAANVLGAATDDKSAQVWPATLPDQVRAVAQMLASAANALLQSAIEARSNGREGEGWREVKVPGRPSAKLHATASISFGAGNSGKEHSNADGVESIRI